MAPIAELVNGWVGCSSSKRSPGMVVRIKLWPWSKISKPFGGSCKLSRTRTFGSNIPISRASCLRVFEISVRSLPPELESASRSKSAPKRISRASMSRIRSTVASPEGLEMVCGAGAACFLLFEENQARTPVPVASKRSGICGRFVKARQPIKPAVIAKAMGLAINCKIDSLGRSLSLDPRLTSKPAAMLISKAGN